MTKLAQVIVAMAEGDDSKLAEAFLPLETW